MFKLLHIIPNLSKGGAERFVADIYNELSKRTDIEVLLATFSKVNEYSFITNELPIKVLNSKFTPSISRKDTFEIQDYEQLIQEFKPNIIHTHLFSAELFSACKVYKNITYVTHGHDNMAQFNKLKIKDVLSKKKLTNYYEKKLLYRKKYRKNPTWIIANSKHTEAFYKSVVPKNMKNKVALIPLGFDYKRFYKSQRNNIGETLKLINVGSFQDKKNQKFILKIAKELLKHTTDFEITLLGDGKNKPLLEQQCKNEGLEKHIIFKGNVNNVEEFLHNSHVYLHVACYEPFGLVFLEAMASGLPIITLDGKGNRDIIEQNKNGYLFYEENTELFAKTILDLKENTEKYSEISEYCKGYSQKFDMEQQVDKFVEFYKSILK